MKKKIFSIIYVLAFGIGLKSQTCTTATNLPINGTLNINGVNVTASSTGDVEMYTSGLSTNPSCNLNSLSFLPNALWAGGNYETWSVTLNFDQPVNDVVFLIRGRSDSVITMDGTFNESFNFSSNSGGISITPINSCGFSTNSNTITRILGSTSGAFKIHASSGYQQLTINGPGGDAGSVLGVCSSSILGVDDINSNMKDDLVNIYPNPVQNNFTISSKDNLRSYEIFDESGRKVMSSSLKGNKQEVDISSLIKGNYIVSIETKQRKINKKISKN